METLPEKIEGIPTAKKQSKERVELIKKYYINLWEKLQKAGRGNKTFCNYLGVDVFIVEGESDKDGKHIQYCVNKVECSQ